MAISIFLKPSITPELIHEQTKRIRKKKSIYMHPIMESAIRNHVILIQRVINPSDCTRLHFPLKNVCEFHEFYTNYIDIIDYTRVLLYLMICILCKSFNNGLSSSTRIFTSSNLNMICIRDIFFLYNNGYIANCLIACEWYLGNFEILPFGNQMFLVGVTDSKNKVNYYNSFYQSIVLLDWELFIYTFVVS